MEISVTLQLLHYCFRHADGARQGDSGRKRSLALHSGRGLGGAPNQLVLTLELQVGRRALERLLYGLLGILAEMAALNAASAGRGV